MVYADAVYYTTIYGGSSIPAADLTRALDEASRQIDSLTYNRIIKQGWDSLTEFQQGVIQAGCCRMADWNHANAEILSAVLSSYSINGVSMTISDGPTLRNVGGVLISPIVYAYLEQSGLCCALLVM